MTRSKEKWDQRWQEKETLPLLPDPWLLRARPFLSGGAALDIACGRGRNALYLVDQGYTVTGIDISGQGLKMLAEEAANRGQTLHLLQRDLERPATLPRGPFDLICMFFYLQRALLPKIKQFVTPGGIVILRTFSTVGRAPEGPSAPDIVLNPGELIEVFANWDVLLYEEGLERSRNGAGLAGIVARKPHTANTSPGSAAIR